MDDPRVDDRRAAQVLDIAQGLFDQDPDWVEFYREIFGIEGTLRHTFPQRGELEAFEQTETYQRLRAMLDKLRERRRGQPARPEPTRVITVRLPKSLHDSLRGEAYERRTSMNRLCIAKLLAPFVPSAAEASTAG